MSPFSGSMSVGAVGIVGELAGAMGVATVRPSEWETFDCSMCQLCGIWGFPKKRVPVFGSPYNKSPTILGYILVRAPDFWSLPFGLRQPLLKGNATWSKQEAPGKMVGTLLPG